MTMPQSVRAKDGGKIPGPANVPGVVEIKMIGTMPNLKKWTCTVHGSFVTSPPNLPSAATALFTSLSGAWSSNLAALMAVQTTFNQVQVRDMSSYTNPVYVGTGTAVPGTSASIAMPPDVSAVLTENVAARGRGSKGRLYLAGWATNADAANGFMAAAVQTGLNGFGTAIVNAISAQGLTACVAKPARQEYLGLTGTHHAARAADKAVVTSMTCLDLKWDTQRRRG